MANDDDVVSRMRLHQECWELLPWVVNGRLSGTDAARVSQHLQECSRCSEELHVQQQLCEAMRRDDPVLLAPQSSLKKLWQRFDTPALSQTTALSETTVPQTTVSEKTMQSAHEAALIQECVPASIAASPMPPASGLSRRMLLALAAQALLIVGLLAWSGWQTLERWQAPRFVTLTTPSTPAERQGAVRVVFLPDTKIQEMNELLQIFEAQVLAGPNTAGVYTLGLSRTANADADVVAGKLRANRHVQFAESTAATVQP